MKKRSFYACCLAVCLIMILAGWHNITAYGEEIPTVKVGFFHMDGYNEMDENGVYSGYDYDFFQMLSRYTSLNFEFVGYDKSWQEMQEMLDSGEIDILTSMHATGARREKYDFSYDIGSSYTMLTVKTANNLFRSGDDISGYDGIRIGMLKESSQNDVFDLYAAEKQFTYTPVYYENAEELSDAIQKEEVDAAVTSSLRQLSGERVIEEISPSHFYAVVKKGNQELLDEINQGITQMDLYEGDWKNTLYYKYYGYHEDSEENIVYSEREQEVLGEYSGEGKTLRVCFDPTLAPYSFVKNGEMIGILPDVIGEMLDSWGINYEFIVTDSYEEYQQRYENGEADVFPEIVDDTSTTGQKNYLFTDEYFTLRLGALTTKTSHNGIRVVGILDNPNLFDQFDMGSDVTVVRYDTVEELLNAAKEETIDAACLMNYTAQMYVNEQNLGNLTYVSQSNLTYDLRFAVNKNLPHEFCSMLNKNVSELSEKDYYSLSLTYIGNDWKDLSFVEYLQIHPATALFLFGLVLVFVVIIMALIFINVQRTKERQMIKERAAEREKQKKELEGALFKAEQANRAKTVFLSNMSHDIRTPMNAIIGFSAMANKYIDQKEQVEDYIDKISSSANHLLLLINDVLDMSRIESGKLAIHEEECNLRELMKNLSDLISSDVHRAGLDFSMEIMEGIHETVLCDKLRLNQVFLNLLSNAIKFTEPGGKIQMFLTEREGQEVDIPLYEIRVRDTGIGMNEEFARRIFEPFERERTSTVSGIQGTGLGMSISKNIVEMMGGTISVISKQGVGSEFTVTIPMKKIDQKESEENLLIQKEEPEVNRMDISGKRVLLVEDNELNREIADDILSDAGLIVEEAENGKIAVERLLEMGAGYYQLVIMDVQMPVMDGYTAARTIRAFEEKELAEIPIIAMTANAFEEDRQKAIEAGMNAHIAKPIEIKTVMETMEQILCGRGKEVRN